ncbi:MAG: histidinol-phosphate transaminase [Candidatus Kinetoplastibacterium crithidii]|nr:histidinol-phosphate transaminase [Candidatus Kinetoplastibacterium crithidii]
MTVKLQKACDFISRTIRQDIQETTSYPISDASGLIKLDAMESPYELPNELREKISKRISLLSFNRYPSTNKKELIRTIKHAFNIPSEADVLFGNGSDELIQLIIQSCCAPGDIVLSPSPSFVYFEMASKFNHAKFVDVPLNNNFQLNMIEMLSAIEKHKPKVIFLAMPNNPTGSLWNNNEVQKIIDNAPGLVVIDEAYQAFTDYTWMQMITKLPNILVLRTVSKIGLAGLRFGYLSGNRDWISQINKVRPPYNINILTENAILEIISNKNILDEQTKQILKNKELLKSELEKFSDITVFPSHANFILIKICNKFDATDLYEKLKKGGVLIKNLSNSHYLLKNCLRVSIGTFEENLILLNILKNLIN